MHFCIIKGFKVIKKRFNILFYPISTKILLFHWQGHVLRVQNDQTIRSSNFDPKKETKILIHGFIDTPLSNWVKVNM
jgi:pancreatic triacylglycerol lipase